MLKQNNPTDICIDKDGIWYFRGAEMKRQDIVQYFYQYLRRDGDGNYLIEMKMTVAMWGSKMCPMSSKAFPLVIPPMPGGHTLSYLSAMEAEKS